MEIKDLINSKLYGSKEAFFDDLYRKAQELYKKESIKRLEQSGYFDGCGILSPESVHRNIDQYGAVSIHRYPDCNIIRYFEPRLGRYVDITEARMKPKTHWLHNKSAYTDFFKWLACSTTLADIIAATHATMNSKNYETPRTGCFALAYHRYLNRPINLRTDFDEDMQTYRKEFMKALRGNINALHGKC